MGFRLALLFFMSLSIGPVKAKRSVGMSSRSSAIRTSRHFSNPDEQELIPTVSPRLRAALSRRKVVE